MKLGEIGDFFLANKPATEAPNINISDMAFACKILLQKHELGRV